MKALPGSFSIFSAFFVVYTACSASLLACGSFWLDVTWVIEYSFENWSNFVETNFGPLSDKISVIPCLANMDFNIVSLDFWDASGIDISIKRE